MTNQILERLLIKELDPWNTKPTNRNYWILSRNLCENKDAKKPINYGLSDEELDSLIFQGELKSGEIPYLGEVYTNKTGEVFVETTGGVLVSRLKDFTTITHKTISLTIEPELSLPYYGIPDGFPSEFRHISTLKTIEALFQK